jgi:hypothetical protein
MCANFFDVRTFGAVMSTGVDCGQVRGPVQLSFAHSIEPVVPLEISITRMAATSEAEKKKREEGADDDQPTENRTMGRKHIVPYGLYRVHGFVSAKLAERTSPMRISRSCGRLSPTCSSTTAPPRAARWRRANSSPSSMTMLSAARRRAPRGRAEPRCARRPRLMRKLWRRTRLGGREREDDRHRRRRGSSGAASPGMGEPTGTPVSV